ncbi:glycosyltransferase family 2 protein [Enterococcus sp. JM9B]|uniref:glycosyltransferase family 2 protein n=1 Tax=Enterococcus sp. JM9B TaxID=1857216 RepID=UPI001374E177|nr:glycosyltransferase family 2 protein [Enterococcus sp. JM9B]KAF1304831.1 glycosyl transferase [Enterococcus sp. JM9B]
MDFENHTFVICAYKESKYLEECIKSLMDQTIKSNVILYSSTPNPYIKNLSRTYDIPFFTSDGGGIGKDWNNALSFVHTKFATIAHQDDFYYPEYLEDIKSVLNEDTLIAFPDYDEWKNGGVIKENKNLKIKRLMLKAMNLFPKSKIWRNRILALGNPICCPAVTYNLKKIKDFKFSESMKVSLDWLAWYQIGKKNGAFNYIDKKLMYHRIHEESETTNTISDNTRTNEDMLMYKKFWPNIIASILMKFYVKSQNTNS